MRPLPQELVTPAGITAIVTAHARVEQTLVTLRRLRECTPPPHEVLVHVDANQSACARAIREAYPDVSVIESATPVGPGGGRNKLVRAAACPVIASFDDDSYPIDLDYFGRMTALFESFPEAAVIAARVFHANETVGAEIRTTEWAADFSGGGCGYRREAFLGVGGYVPLPMAYNMEEVDFALRLHAQGGRVLRAPWLRVFHDTDLARHADAAVTSASIANLALLAYLRYPVALWAVGAAQVGNRLQWLLRNGRRQGVLTGLFRIPSHLRAHRRYRERLSARAIRSYLALRRTPVPAVPRPVTV